MQIRFPVPMVNFNSSSPPNFCGSCTGSNTWKFLVAALPGKPDFLISMGDKAPYQRQCQQKPPSGIDPLGESLC